MSVSTRFKIQSCTKISRTIAVVKNIAATRNKKPLRFRMNLKNKHFLLNISIIGDKKKYLTSKSLVVLFTAGTGAGTADTFLLSLGCWGEIFILVGVLFCHGPLDGDPNWSFDTGDCWNDFSLAPAANKVFRN